VFSLKRKVIQIANSTQLISLPRKWSLKYGVRKGDEIEVEENGNKIVVSTEGKLEPIQIELKPPHLKNITERYVTSSYRDGINELKVICDSESYNDLLEYITLKMHDQTIGYELINQGKNFFIVKDLSGGPPTGFDSALRRTFLLLITSSDDILNAMKNQDAKALRNALVVDRSINKMTNFCSRLLLTKGLDSLKKTIYHYHFIRSLEALADQYSLMAVQYSYNIKAFNKEILKSFEKINGILQEFYELFYNFDKTKLNSLFLKIKDLEPQKLFRAKNTNYDVVYFLATIHRRIKELIDSLIEFNLESG